jgi:hypothetical protein
MINQRNKGKRGEITQKLLKEILKYNPKTGLFTWRVNRSSNARVGSVAGSRDAKGYIKMKLYYKNYSAHRLAFLYMTGSFPKEGTDHINGVRSDNRWSNLREATQQQNVFNRKSTSKSGIKGVSKHRNKYRAASHIKGKMFYLGLYKTPEEASKVYKEFCRKNHGEFCYVR